MNRLTSRIVFGFSLVLLFSASAFAQNSHSVWSDKPLIIRDWNTKAEFKPPNINRGDAIFAWTQATPRAYAHAHGVVNAGLNYDFMLVAPTASDVDSISGRWIVRRNGVIVCNNCIGKAYGLSQAAGVGNYFKIYVGTPMAYAEHWLYSGYITSRFDF